MSAGRSGARGGSAFLNRATAERWLRADAGHLGAYVLAGGDAVAREELRTALISRFAASAGEAVSRTDHDAGADPPVDLLDALRAMSLFSSARVVVVRRAERIGTGERHPGLVELLQGIDASLLVIFEMEGKAADLAKMPLVDRSLERKAAAYCYPPRDDADAIRWVREYAERHRWTMPREAAEAMVALVGIEPLELASEVRKVAFASEGRVTLAAVRDLLVSHREREVFDWVEAVSQGARSAVRMVSSATAAGREGPAAVGALAARLDQLEAVLKGQATLPGFILQKVQAVAPRWSLVTVNRARRILLELDLTLKSTPAETHLARIELATLKLVELAA